MCRFEKHTTGSIPGQIAVSCGDGIKYFGSIKIEFFVRGAISNPQVTSASLTDDDHMLHFALSCSLLVLYCRLTEQEPRKRWHLITRIRGVINQRTTILNFTTVKI